MKRNVAVSTRSSKASCDKLSFIKDSWTPLGSRTVSHKIHNSYIVLRSIVAPFYVTSENKERRAKLE